MRERIQSVVKQLHRKPISLGLLLLLGVFGVGYWIAAHPSDLGLYVNGSFNPYRSQIVCSTDRNIRCTEGGTGTPCGPLLCSDPSGSCVGQTQGKPCGTGGTCQQPGVCLPEQPDYDNCPAGPNGAVCKDQFGVTISCANPDQADRDLDMRGDICDTCGDTGGNGVFSITTLSQWDSTGGGVAGTGVAQGNVIGCSENGLISSTPCTDNPFACEGEGSYCDANNLRCSNNIEQSCLRDVDCGFGGTCERYCTSNRWCDDADGALRLENRVTQTPYIWIPRGGYDTATSAPDALLRLRTDLPLNGAGGPGEQNPSILEIGDLIGDTPTRVAVDLEKNLVWVGNQAGHTVTLLSYEGGDGVTASAVTSIFQCPTPRGPLGLALMADGAALVTGQGTSSPWPGVSDSRVFAYRAGIFQCPTSLSTLSTIRSTHSVADARGIVWLADSWNGMLHKLRVSDTTIIASIDLRDACAPDFGNWRTGGPAGITIDQLDNIWVSCVGGSQIRPGIQMSAAGKTGLSVGRCRANPLLPCLRSGADSTTSSGVALNPTGTTDRYKQYNNCSVVNFTPNTNDSYYWPEYFDEAAPTNNGLCCIPEASNDPACQGIFAPTIALAAPHVIKIDTNTKRSCSVDTDCYASAPAGTCTAGVCDHVLQIVDTSVQSSFVGTTTPSKYCTTDRRVQCTSDVDCPDFPALVDPRPTTEGDFCVNLRCTTNQTLRCVRDADCSGLPSKEGQCALPGMVGNGAGVAVDLDNNVWVVDSDIRTGSVHQLAYPYYQDLGECVVPPGTPSGGSGACSLGACEFSKIACGTDAECRAYSGVNERCAAVACINTAGSCGFQNAFPVGGSPTGVAVDSLSNVWVLNSLGGGPNVVGLSPDPAADDPTSSPGSVTRLVAKTNYTATSFTTGGLPITLSDFSGLQRGLLVRTGAWSAVYDSKAATTLWHRVAFDSLVYEASLQNVTVRLNAAEDPAEFNTPTEVWDYERITNENGFTNLSNLTLVGRFLHIELGLRSSMRDSSPVIKNLTINFGRCSQASGQEFTCNNGTDDDGDGYVDCADFDCRGQTDGSGAVCCGNSGVAGFADNNACGACSVCSTGTKENTAYPSLGTNNSSDTVYRCAVGPNGTEGNKCTGPCTQCQLGSCVNRTAGDQTECGVSCFACGANGGGCTVPTANESDDQGPAFCQSGNTCTNGVCAPIGENCAVPGDEDGNGYEGCNDFRCAGQLDPLGNRCCTQQAHCGTCSQCNDLGAVGSICQAVTAPEGYECSGACTQCSNGSCIGYANGQPGECSVGFACQSGACSVAVAPGDGVCNVQESSSDCTTELFCADFVDNDQNGCVDRIDAACGGVENCTTSADDDCDGQVNGLDPDCGGVSCPANGPEAQRLVVGRNDCNACLVAGDQDGNQPGVWPTAPIVNGLAPVDRCDASCNQNLSATTQAQDFEATETRCDGIDNDCDGTVDNLSTVVCPAGQICQSGACVVGTAPADSQAPVVVVTTPSNSVFGGSTAPQLTVSGTVSDATTGGSGVASVEVRLNGGAWQAATLGATWSRTLTLSAGQNTIEIRSTDTAGNVTASPFPQLSALYDAVAPTATITGPSSATALPIALSGTASDANPGSGVALIELRVNGGTWTPMAGTANWNASVSSGMVSGPNTIEVRASDIAGNLGIASQMQVSYTPPDTTAPTITLTAPSAGVVSGTIAVSATAADTVGVAGVTFLLDGVPMAADDTAAPFTLSWDTNSVVTPNGNYQVSARARDAAGNMTTSAAVTVQVQNQINLALGRVVTPRTPGECDPQSGVWSTSCCQASPSKMTAGRCNGYGVFPERPIPTRATDGTSSTFWCSLAFSYDNTLVPFTTWPPYADWVILDLGSTRQVSRVVVEMPAVNSPYDCSPASDYLIETSTTGTADANFTVWGVPADDVNAATEHIDITKPASSVRYIRFKALRVVDNQTWNFAIRELQAWGL